ncbi:MAG: serine/threonine protein kinase [Alteromonadaceae bacterium]|nr:MAG: serine/threonine protein kinase [Alteromonadaceae bacterium]
MSEAVVIPGYTVHKLLGSGTMACVYLATQESLQRQVAVKILNSHSPQADPKANERFVNEAHIIAAVNHPNIVTIHDIAELEDGRSYISMEYLSGGDLTHLKGQALGESYALAMIRKVALGLAAIHKKNIIHRDIKPANILFRDNGGIVLSDFGIAKNLELDSQLTQTGLAIGSVAYSSPEQIYGSALDPRSDIYSLGVVLLELLSGNNPYSEDNYARTLVNHTEKPIPDLSHLPEPYQQLLEKMLAKQVTDRHADVDELLAEIDTLLGQATADSDDATLLHLAAKPVVVFDGELIRLGQIKRLPARVKWIGLSVLALSVILLAGLAMMPFAPEKSEADLQVEALLNKAKASLNAGQLILPESDSAEYYFKQALQIQPENSVAVEGFNQVNDLLIKRYLDLAEQRVLKLRLTRPAEDNATYYFRKVLAMETENQAALEGLKKVDDLRINRYLGLAEKRISKLRLSRPAEDNAIYFYRKVLAIEAKNQAALEGLKKVDSLFVKRYLGIADQRISQLRLSRPTKDNAIYYYRKVLAMDAKNKTAQAGLQRVADKYRYLADKAYRKKEYSVGKGYIASGLALSPGDKLLLALKNKYERKRNPVRRFFKKAFR